MNTVKKSFNENNGIVKDYLISSEKVAHVQAGNSLMHALLVLTKTGYSSIPVLDYSYKLQGLISMPKIMDTTLGIERIEFENLDTIKVEEIMNKDIPTLHEDSSFQEGVMLLIDHPFVCVVDDNDSFTGIFTRREALKRWKKLNFTNKIVG